MVVQPCLERVDVDLGRSLASRRLLVGDVFVDPPGSVSRLIEGHGADGDQERDDGSGEDRVDDQDREGARHLEAREVADERIQREGDHAGGQEEEEDVAERSREKERQNEQNGETDELDPPRNLNRRAGAGHERMLQRGRAGLGRSGPCYGPANGDSALTSRRAASCGPAARAGASQVVRDRSRRRGSSASPRSH